MHSPAPILHPPTFSTPLRLRAAFAAITSLLALHTPLHADEGMWPFNRIPAAAMERSVGFVPSPAWLEHVRLSSARIAGGCSASFVSPQGLVMTNHHCVRGCIDAVGAGRGFDAGLKGFLARNPADEARCPGMELQQLVGIEDVTAQVRQAVDGVPADGFDAALKGVSSAIEGRCGTADNTRCELVTLYRGGRYDLYRYRRYTDVRLVFAPEDTMAFFGGDPDNFEFPRADLDVAFLRVRDASGAPSNPGQWLRWSDRAPVPGEAVLVSGNPGGTSRALTLAQLDHERDVALPQSMNLASELRGRLGAYVERGPEERQRGLSHLFGIENWLKGMKGRHGALADPAFHDVLARNEALLRARVDRDPQLRASAGGAWDRIAQIVAQQRVVQPRYDALEGSPRSWSTLFGLARSVLRHADERHVPDAQRLREFRAARVRGLEQVVLSDRPLHEDREIEDLRFGLTKLREELGADDPIVRTVLGKASPEQVARDAVQRTGLRELKLDANGRPVGGRRLALWNASADELRAARDPMIELARALDAGARAARTTFETTIEGPLRQQHEAIAAARFKLDGESVAPDATFTLRLSAGRVEGWDDPVRGRVAPVTTIADAFARHTGSEPYALPATWLAARDRLDAKTALNFVTTNDIIGGNSGSPMVDRDAKVIGLVFDGNIHSLGGDYGYDARLNRTIAVSTAAIAEAMRKVYGAGWVVDELQRAAAVPR